MANKWTRRTAALLTFLFSPLAFASSDDDSESATDAGTTESAETPEAVRLSMARTFPRAAIVSSSVERHEHGDAWRLRLQERLNTVDVVVHPGGEIVAQREHLPAAAAPRAIRQALARQFGSPTLWHAEHFRGAGEEAWLVSFSRGERTGHALFDGEGKLVHGELDALPRSRPSVHEG